MILSSIVFNPARGGQGFNSTPLGAFNAFVFDTPLLAAGQFI
jgi:hypothetical protein